MLEFIGFLFLVGFISLSGVMMPGPVVTAAIVKGTEHRHAGAWIAMGHMIIEIPLIIALAVGLSFIFTNIWFKLIIGMVGGALLVIMGFQMIRMRAETEVVKHTFPSHPMVAGIVTTISNPYFVLWWATVGVALVFSALSYGFMGVIAFIIVHESCDLGWDWFVSYSVFKSKRLWGERAHSIVFGICGALLIIFGVSFIFAFWFI